MLCYLTTDSIQQREQLWRQDCYTHMYVYVRSDIAVLAVLIDPKLFRIPTEDHIVQGLKVCIPLQRGLLWDSVLTVKVQSGRWISGGFASFEQSVAGLPQCRIFLTGPVREA